MIRDNLKKHFGQNILNSYDQFMNFKLYDSNQGYYSKSNKNLWESDYFTSPMIHPVFAYLIARYIYSTWLTLNKPSDFHLIEIGGGGLYLIKEIINSLKLIDQKFSEQCKIIVIDKNFHNTLDIDNDLNLVIADTFCFKNIKGFVLSNELFDAMPFKRIIYKNDKYYEILFKINDGLNEELEQINFESFSYFESSNYSINNKVYTYSDLHENLINQIWAGLDLGVVLSFDYGYTSDQLNANASLNTDSRVISNNKIIRNLYPSEKSDISCFVNFDLLNIFYKNAGFESVYLGSQSDFLNQLGIKGYAKAYYDSNRTIADKSKTMRFMQDLVDEEIFGNYLVLAVSKGKDNINQNQLVNKINSMDILIN